MCSTVRADATADLRLGPSRWQLGSENLGVGRHHTDYFQDPTFFGPDMRCQRFRTTLLRDQGIWYVMELCEPLDSLIDLTAPFYGYEGPRDTLTIITDSEKDPVLMMNSLRCWKNHIKILSLILHLRMKW